MRIRYVALVFVFCALLTLSSVQNTSAEPRELKFDDTYSGPYLDKIIYKVLGTESNLVQALLDDEIDIYGGPISEAYHSGLEADPDIELSTILRNGYGLITINCQKAPLNWTPLRQAFALAYNKTRVQDIAFGGQSLLHDSLVPSANSLFCIEDELPYDYYDVEVSAGNALLDAAGFAVNGGTGFRDDPNGNPIHIVIAYYGGSSYASTCGLVGAEALTALGISVELNAGDFNTILGNMYNHGDYDMIVRADTFDNLDVDWLADQYWSENTEEYMKNPSNYVNGSFDLLVEQLINGTTFEEVYNAAHDMQQILHQDVPELVVYENYITAAYRTDRFYGHVADVFKNIGNEWTNVKVRLPLLDGGPFTGTLRVGMMHEPSSFNPMTTSSSYSWMIIENMFSSLLQTGPDGTKRLDLAESYTIETHDTNPSITDGRSRFTFDIVQNATWSDGTPLTGDDVSYTFLYLASSYSYGNPMGLSFQNLVVAYSPLPYRVVLEFDTESYWLLSRITDIPIFQRTLLEDITPSGWNSWDPVRSDPCPTSGPFNITDFSWGDYYELSYHRDFHYGVRGTGSDFPVIEEQADFEVVQSPYMGELTWNVIDDNPLLYRIYYNDTLMEISYFEESPITVDLDNYSLGLHNFTLVILDYEYQEVVDEVLITVIPDTFDPEIEGPDLIILYEDSTEGFEINWSVFDHNPSNYTIDVNGTEIVTTTWTWGTDVISHFLGNLEIANYTYTLTVRDTYGHSSDWTILVSVTERPSLIVLEQILMIGAGVAVVVIVGGIVLKKRQ